MTATILFMCAHGEANSVIAAGYFNQLARQSGLSISANAVGLNPYFSVSPVVVAMLRRDGIDVSQHQPRLVSSEELDTARRVVAIDCCFDMPGIPCERVEQWDDIPLFHQ